MSNLQGAPLAPDVEKQLRKFARSKDTALNRRARLILLWVDGNSYTEIAAETGLSLSGVRHWVKQFRERGLDIFAEPAAEIAPTLAPAAPVAPPPKTPATKPAAQPRGRKPAASKQAAPEPAVVVEVPPPPPEPTVSAPTTAPKRGRPAKVKQVAPPPILQPEPEPEPPAPVYLPPPAEPPAARRRGRPAKVVQAPPLVIEFVAEPLPEPVPEPVAEAALVAKPGRGRPKGTKAKPVAPEIVEPPKPAKPITTVTELVNFYGVSLPHARHVTQLAYRLFDATAELHHLPDNMRMLLEAGALLHEIADAIDLENHHLRARDIIIETPLTKFGPEERRIIALLAAFHRKRVHPEKEPLFQDLSPALKRDTLALAALLRIADGLDHSMSQSTAIVEVQITRGEMNIWLVGANAADDAMWAKAKADLWEKHFSQRVSIAMTPERESEPPPVPILMAPPMLRDHMPDLVLTLDSSMSGVRAVRKLGQHYLDRLDRVAAHVRAGSERRLALFLRELDRVGGLLRLADIEQLGAQLTTFGEDVNRTLIAYELHDRALTIADDADDWNSMVVASKMDAWRDSARTALRGLDFDRYDYLVTELRRELVAEPGNDNGALIGTMVAPVIWGQLAELRDVVERGDSVSDALTAARRLQDLLLYFRSLLGTETLQALDMLAPFESFLSAIHVVQSILGVLGTDPASEILRNAQMDVLNELADGLPSIWASVNSVTFRRSVALALAAP